VPKHLKRLVDILAQISGADPHSIRPQTRLLRELGLDTLDIEDIEHEIAIEFGVDLDLIRAGDITVQQILDMLSESLEW